ncbi:2-deoxyglucose-6-phosphate phosphatase, putative [Entamoeba invadens IP1]|uniref:2-deoxyglucose-6-phosphate phosphatase, putative n=1 Tax=Entamoeba invadens IP1 TaxID=370355 RepID=A0A0A1U4S2_ENTIV|nr:2-deoxyglucose-6-phosphate phosphatase, putative [Entamoeba invadens IP1]ELP89236.1 2-deoxyglucose-6-phosphate phosphatase, putative [Entamoeba invadens IP1]|eukprot:XP_004256007.1 2-deoxyglucose-6-phosphate phosphatase, putative [Entamoeba invadens IP1]
MKAVIFDFNGTLLFDGKLHREAWNAMSLKYKGRPFTDVEWENINGSPNSRLVEFVLNRQATLEEVKDIGLEKEKMYQKFLDQSGLELCDGAISLFESLAREKVPFGIATSSGWENVEVFVEKFKLLHWFDMDHIIYNDGSLKGKPNPDIYLKAASKLGANPKRCVVFEDAISGVKSATSAGCIVVAVASDLKSDVLEKLESVKLVINDFKAINVNALNKLVEE